jgi:hypothetical protein
MGVFNWLLLVTYFYGCFLRITISNYFFMGIFFDYY